MSPCVKVEIWVAKLKDILRYPLRMVVMKTPNSIFCFIASKKARNLGELFERHMRMKMSKRIIKKAIEASIMYPMLSKRLIGVFFRLSSVLLD